MSSPAEADAAQGEKPRTAPTGKAARQVRRGRTNNSAEPLGQGGPTDPADGGETSLAGLKAQLDGFQASVEAQLERVLARQEQVLAGAVPSTGADADGTALSQVVLEPKANGPELQVQLARLAAAQEEMKIAIMKLSGTTKMSRQSRPTRSPPVDGDQQKGVDGKVTEKEPSQRKTSANEDIDAGDGELMMQMMSMSSKAQRESATDLAEQAEREELRKVFDASTKHKAAVANHEAKSYATRFQELTPEGKSSLVDVFIGAVICVNMFFIGISMDKGGTTFFLIVDTVLSVIFITEVIVKVSIFGIGGHFCPKGMVSKLMTWNDTAIVVVDLAQLSFQYATLNDEETDSDDGPRTSLLRIFRLLRLSRIMRLLRLEAFHDLILMINGLAVGMPTLVWAIVLLFIFMYAVALIGRLALGSGGPVAVREQFDSVGNALFAVFRCSFGDCSTKDGVSLLAMVIDFYGMFTGAICGLCIFFVTIGMFNVISAIFVEGTLSARMYSENVKKKERLNDYTRFAENMHVLLERVFKVNFAPLEEHCSEHVRTKSKLSFAPGQSRSRSFRQPDFTMEQLDAWSHLEVDTADFRESCITDELVMGALKELEIHEGDFEFLGDILDPQNDLKLTVSEILHGITRLRGDPRRSDIVTIDLTIRDVQKSVSKLLDGVSAVLSKLEAR